MNIGKTLGVRNRNVWRKWLQNNSNKEKEIWLIFFRKSTGKQTVSLQEAMDEAICFGWIDSFEKGMDQEKFALRFSPRRPNSNWSKPNLKRAKRLIAEGKMTKTGLEILKGWIPK